MNTMDRRAERAVGLRGITVEVPIRGCWSLVRQRFSVEESVNQPCESLGEPPLKDLFKAKRSGLAKLGKPASQLLARSCNHWANVIVCSPSRLDSSERQCCKSP
jgi:hypothetical protein